MEMALPMMEEEIHQGHFDRRDFSFMSLVKRLPQVDQMLVDQLGSHVFRVLLAKALWQETGISYSFIHEEMLTVRGARKGTLAYDWRAFVLELKLGDFATKVMKEGI